jgi:hypothetical protein
MALTVIERAGAQRDAAVGLKADAAHFLVGRRGHFEEAADADAAHAAALPALALSLVEALPVRGDQRLLQDRREVAAVIGGAGGGFERDLAFADLVLAAKLDAIAVPYKGEGPALVGLIGGETTFAVTNLAGSTVSSNALLTVLIPVGDSLNSTGLF